MKFLWTYEKKIWEDKMRKIFYEIRKKIAVQNVRLYGIATLWIAYLYNKVQWPVKNFRWRVSPVFADSNYVNG